MLEDEPDLIVVMPADIRKPTEEFRVSHPNPKVLEALHTRGEWQCKVCKHKGMFLIDSLRKAGEHYVGFVKTCTVCKRRENQYSHEPITHFKSGVIKARILE